MNSLTRFLDWLDEAAAGFIRLAYLLAGITAVALYFGAGHLPSFIEDPLNGALPWMLASAVEMHTYITARRVRAAWQEKNAGALKVNLAILAGLLAFSAWNQLNYLVETWVPPVGALPLPAWTSYLVRALVVPCAFMAAAFLAPMAEPVTVQIMNEARATLGDVFKIARKQRRRMLKEAERSGRDMTGALVELVPDLETRRIISHAYNAIGAPVQPVGMLDTPVVVEATPAPSGAHLDTLAGTPVDAPANTTGGTISTLQLTPSGDDQRLPTGPGTPRRRKGVITPTGEEDTNVVRMPSPNSRPRRARTVAKRRSGRGPRPSVEDRARQHWQPGMSASELARLAHIGKSAASKYRTALTIEYEQAQAGQSAEQVAQQLY